jgi:hypothetical protein
LAWCCRKPKDGNAVLKRYASYPGIKENVETNYSFPAQFQNVVNKLEYNNRTVFYKLFGSKLKKDGDNKLFCKTYEGDTHIWNAHHIELVPDEFLKRLLRHVSNLAYDKNIQFAVGLKLSKEHSHIFKCIGYHIFAKLSDGEIGKRFKMFPKQVEAIRNLFFDFASVPTEVTARAAYFTQLVDNNVISDLERRYYKLVGELGETGLKAHSNYHALNAPEKALVEEYLGNSMLDNVLNLNFAVTDMKDALNFNSVINNLASFYIKKEEVNYYRSKVRNLDASTARIVNDNSQDAGMIDSDDQEALKLIGRLALKENSLPEYKSITELNSI